MKARIIISIVINFLAHGFSFGQKAIEFGFGQLFDRSFNRIDHNIRMLNPPSLDNRYSLFTQVKYSGCFSKSVSGLVGLRATLRKFKYYYPGDIVDDFNYQTLELPIGLRFNNQISENCRVRFDIEGGVNLAITSDNKTLVGDLDGNFFQFSTISRLAYFFQPGIGIETKINEEDFLCFFVSYQYQLNSLFRYRVYNSWFDFYGSPINMSNFNVGISYKFM